MKYALSFAFVLLSFLHTNTVYAASVSLGQYTAPNFGPRSDNALPGVSVAWLGGADPCFKKVVLAGANISPCGLRFTVSNDKTVADLHFEGCGGPLQLFQGDDFIANCGDDPSANDFFCGCGSTFDCSTLNNVKQVFSCSFDLALVETIPALRNQGLKNRMDSKEY